MSIDRTRVYLDCPGFRDFDGYVCERPAETELTMLAGGVPMVFRPTGDHTTVEDGKQVEIWSRGG